jgi:hypothetical protein
MTCLFCEIPDIRVIASNPLAYAIRDNFPVTSLHTLVIPKRHVLDYFSLSKEELIDIQGQLHNLFVIENIPLQIERELQTLLEREEHQRELKESIYASRTSF